MYIIRYALRYIVCASVIHSSRPRVDPRARCVVFFPSSCTGHGLHDGASYAEAHSLQECRSCFDQCTCWARWILAGELTWRARNGVVPDAYATSVMRDVWPGWNPWRVTTTVATDAKRARLTEHASPRQHAMEATEGSTWFCRLDKLMTWNSIGLLSNAQFEEAMLKLDLPRT